MDVYPTGYVEHNWPLLLLFGLDGQGEATTDAQERSLLQDGGFTVKSDLPPVSGDRVDSLVEELRKADGATQPWRPKASGNQGGLIGYRIKSTGRVRFQAFQQS